MIISHKHRFIFLKNPKTASSAINLTFRTSGIQIDYARAFIDHKAIGPNWTEGFDTEAILNMGFASEADFKTYDLYGVYRDPVEVFLSWYTYNTRHAQINLFDVVPNSQFLYPAVRRFFTQQEKDSFQKELDTVTPRFMFDQAPIKGQTHYIGNPRVQIIDYTDLEAQIGFIINKYNGTFNGMSKINSFKNPSDFLDDSLIHDIKIRYAEDYKLKDRIVSFKG